MGNIDNLVLFKTIFFYVMISNEKYCFINKTTIVLSSILLD